MKGRKEGRKQAGRTLRRDRVGQTAPIGHGHLVSDFDF